MKKFLGILKEIALYIWQLPQNIVGLIFMLFLQPTTKVDSDVETIATVYKSDKMSGGVSLGKYAFVSNISAKSIQAIKHEGIGHAKQSLYLGPLYLIVIGLPSLIWAGLYGGIIPYTKNGYYKFYPEKWADKLAGIKRN